LYIPYVDIHLNQNIS